MIWLLFCTLFGPTTHHQPSAIYLKFLDLFRIHKETSNYCNCNCNYNYIIEDNLERNEKRKRKEKKRTRAKYKIDTDNIPTNSYVRKPKYSLWMSDTWRSLRYLELICNVAFVGSEYIKLIFEEVGL
jgi:hypothetical protein